MDELLEQFVLEGRDLVQQASRDLLALEQAGHDPALVDSAFRAIHTLKGSAGLFDFAPLGAMLHAAEDLMGTLRGGHATLPPGTIGALLGCIAATDTWIEAVAVTEQLPADAAARSRELIGQLREASGATPGQDEPGPTLSAFRYVPAADCFFLGDDPLDLVRSLPSLQVLAIEPRVPWVLEAYDPLQCNLVITGICAAPPDAVRAVFRLVPDQVEVQPVSAPAQPQAEPQAAPQAAPRTLRVDAGQIDTLADLVGELFIAKNRLAHLAAETADPALGRALAANHADLDALAGTLHRSVMDLRMVPLEQSLRRLPLMVRETAARLGRSVRFTMEGMDTRADKATADGLFEPLLHVLRNAADHGIEPPGRRSAAGKPAEGRIALQARLSSGQVVVTVTDDGAGIDPADLRRTALARGIRTEAALGAMDDAAVLDLVFVPGFSTAASVTDVSGRGVGMDAVRTALHAMGGEVAINAAHGGGTIVRLTVPQAVTVTTVVMVQSGGEWFGIPIEQIVETARVPQAAILPAGSGAAFVLRDRTLAFLRLADLLGQDLRSLGAPAGQPGRTDERVVVVAAGAGRVGIGVDAFGARLDVVVRPLHGLLADMPGMRGSALGGDGRVLLVLDVAELAG